MEEAADRSDSADATPYHSSAYPLLWKTAGAARSAGRIRTSATVGVSPARSRRRPDDASRGRMRC
jgi:hypothetical protein